MNVPDNGNARPFSGLEVARLSGLETFTPNDIHWAEKSCEITRETKPAGKTSSIRSILSNDRRVCGCTSAVWVLAILAIICLAAALGGGIGGGLAAQRKNQPA